MSAAFTPTTGAYRIPCDECEGRGQINWFASSEPWSRNCTDCDGSGFTSGWLCNGCDGELDNGVCADCETVFTDAVERDLRFTIEMQKRRAA